MRTGGPSGVDRPGRGTLPTRTRQDARAPGEGGVDLGADLADDGPLNGYGAREAVVRASRVLPSSR